MTATALIIEINKLPLKDKLILVEATLKTIRQEKTRSLENAVQALYADYKNNKELTIFTQLDSESFYDAR